MTAASAKKFLKADIEDQVRMAMPIARELLIEGIDTRITGETSISDLIEGLIGHCGWSEETVDDKTAEKVDEATYAAYAVGIAVGILLSPAFVGGETLKAAPKVDAK